MTSIALQLLQSIARIQDEAEFDLLQFALIFALVAVSLVIAIASSIATVFLTIALLQ